MSNKYARRTPNGEEWGAFEWGSRTVTRSDERVPNSKHIAVIVPRSSRKCRTKDRTVPGLLGGFWAHPSCRPAGCTIQRTVQPFPFNFPFPFNYASERSLNQTNPIKRSAPGNMAKQYFEWAEEGSNELLPSTRLLDIFKEEEGEDDCKECNIR